MSTTSKWDNFQLVIQSSWCTSASDHDTRDPRQSRLAATEHSMRGSLSKMQNTNQLSSVSCPSASVACFISIHSWDSTRTVMAASRYRFRLIVLATLENDCNMVKICFLSFQSVLGYSFMLYFRVIVLTNDCKQDKEDSVISDAVPLKARPLWNQGIRNWHTKTNQHQGQILEQCRCMSTLFSVYLHVISNVVNDGWECPTSVVAPISAAKVAFA